MKAKLQYLLIALALLAGIDQATAQGARFFRIVGPTAVTITAFNPDGTIVWSNAQPDATYTVQTVSSLPGGTNWVDYSRIYICLACGINCIGPIFDLNPPPGMALIPAGVFTIGDTLDGESDAIPTNVTVSAFYMDTNLVSYGQWQSVYNWATNNGYSFDYAGSGKAANQPVQTVDWFDMVKWCNARSQQAGLTPVYYTNAALTQVYTTGQALNPYVNWTTNGYRLPTEAEWEKAARGGLSGLRFPWGLTISWSQANYYGNPGSLGGYAYDLATVADFDPAFSDRDNGDYPFTSPVGFFAPNGYGLYDMAGNMGEWCWDWYAPPPYPIGSPYLGGTDPHGPVNTVGGHVLRGGDWADYAYSSRCAWRSDDDPNSAGSNGNSGGRGAVVGFRCVRGL